jgi:hypothetical protein
MTTENIAKFAARHAAAELANEHASMAEDLRKEVERCFDIAQVLDAMNPTLPGAFTGTPSERIQRQMDAMARDVRIALPGTDLTVF